MTKLGMEAKIGSPQDYARFIAEETPRWNAIVKSSGVKISVRPSAVITAEVRAKRGPMTGSARQPQSITPGVRDFCKTGVTDSGFARYARAPE